ncbi:MAG: radical SAM family heme chaperone HemW [Bacilli bacterium]|nr:radical SAM family heme chaperone HemW [Bacilli bacterium]MDD4005665.1 radical SAM family heme chaperone HemW [Bacilli bacterium]
MNKHLSPIRTKTKNNALYVHIPFCHHLCHYCDFTKMLYDEKMAFSYLDNLLEEIDSYQIDKVDTIYVGGGTPSSLSIELLKKLLDKISPLINQGGEFTFEVNVENIDFEKLTLLKKYGVNRLSIGVQSTDDAILKSLNRQHSFRDVEKVVSQARQMGFHNLNLDLIYGVPLQSKAVLRKDLKRLISLNPEHISIYSLTIHSGTVFYLKGITEQNEDDSRNHYDLILEFLRSKGYDRYEVSNFAKPGFFSRHNLTYWRNKEYYGVGLGASGYVMGIRYENTRNMSKYLKGVRRQSEEFVSLEDDEKYYWLLNLRLEQGFAIDEYLQRYGQEILDRRLAILHDAIKDKLVLKSNGRIRLSDEGIMILDRILLKII